MHECKNTCLRRRTPYATKTRLIEDAFGKYELALILTALEGKKRTIGMENLGLGIEEGLWRRQYSHIRRYRSGYSYHHGDCGEKNGLRGCLPKQARSSSSHSGRSTPRVQQQYVLRTAGHQGVPVRHPKRISIQTCEKCFTTMWGNFTTAFHDLTVI